MATTKQVQNAIPVIELVRTSTDRQDMARQRTSIDKYRESYPAQVVERFEIAFSATKPLAQQGAQAQRLIALAKAKAFRELRVAVYDRLFGARSFDPRIQAEIQGLCIDSDAVLVEVEQGVVIKPGTFEGNLMAAFKGAVAAQGRVSLLTNANQGRVEAAIKGRAPNGRPYGRRYNNDPLYRRWEYDPIEEPILREVIKWVLSGWSITSCARELNRYRVLVESLVERLRDGAKLNRVLDALDERDELLVRILRSDRVTELLTNGADSIAVVDRCFMPLLGGGDRKRRDGKFKTNRWWERTLSGMLRMRHLVGERPYTNKYRPGWQGTYNIPPILTEAEFQTLQDKLDGRRRTGRPPTTHNAICRGRIFCACGMSLQVKVSGHGRTTYRCASAHSQHLDSGGQRCPYVKPREVSIVDNAAWAAIVAYLNGDPSVYADAANGAPDLAPYRKEVARCEREKAAAKRRAEVLMLTFGNEQMLASTLQDTGKKIAAQLKQLDAEERAARAVLARLEASQATRSSLAAAIGRARARVRSASVADRQAVIQELIPAEVGHGIFVQPDGQVEIVLGLLTTDGAGGENGASSAGSGGGRRGAKVGVSARPDTDYGAGQIIPLRIKARVDGGAPEQAAPTKKEPRRARSAK